jgi:putative heme-binding domain-containing protein
LKRLPQLLIWFLLVCASTIVIYGLDRYRIPTGNPIGRDPEDIQAGKSRFESACAICHGVKGEGGRGSKLADSSYIREMTNQEILDVIRNGVTGTEMMAFAFSDRENRQLVAYIRSLNVSAWQQDVAGDVAAGQRLFFGDAGCSTCHMIAGRGGVLGPDLSNLGAERSVERISESLRHPGAHIDPRYRNVNLVMLDGRIVQGLAKNDSTYSIQAMDLNGKFQFFLKSELQKVIYAKESPMPVVDLSGKDFQNLLAFLSRQTPEGISRSQAGANRGE